MARIYWVSDRRLASSASSVAAGSDRKTAMTGDRRTTTD
jgi:hypothetical protein